MNRNLNAVGLITHVLDVEPDGHSLERFVKGLAHPVPHLEDVPVRNRRKSDRDRAFAVGAHELRRLVVHDSAHRRDVLQANLTTTGADRFAHARRRGRKLRF